MTPTEWRDAGEWLELLGHRIFCVDSGGVDRPVLLLLHGFPTSSFDWVKTWPALSARFRCVAPDFLGLGFSDKPRGRRYSIHEQADLVEALIERLGLTRFHALAHDYGDTVAQELLARDNARPPGERRLESLSLLNGGLFPETHRARPIQKLLATRLGPTLTRVLARRSFGRAFSRVFGAHTMPSEAELDAHWEIIDWGDGRHAFASLITYMADRRAHRARWLAALRESHCPLQLINGSADPVSGAHMVARYRELVPRPTAITELPEIGHYPQIEAPSAVTRAYLAFIDDRAATPPARWDVLIRGATVYDGRGGEGVREDVAIEGGRVVARGAALDASNAAEVIDATGRWLVPGLLDIHTHFDLEVELAPGLPEAVRHGTTTVVMSNCSLGLAFGNQRRSPHEQGADPIVDCFARVENVPKPVLSKVADRATWTDSDGYLAHLESLPLGPNVVPMIPHSMLRIEVMGLAGSLERDPTEAELAEMERRVEKGMREGYAGFSTDALPFHYLANQPNERKKIPGQYASYGEIARLTEVVRRFDRVWQATPPKDDPLEIVRLFSLTSGRLHRRALRTTAVAALDVESNHSLVKLGAVLSRVLNGPLKGHFRLQALASAFTTWAEGPITPIAEEIPSLRVLNETELEDREGRARIMDDPAWQRDFLTMWRTGKRGLSLARLKRLLSNEDFAIRRDLADMRVDRAPVHAWSGETLQTIFERWQRFRAGASEAAREEAERRFFASLPADADDAVFMMSLLRAFDRDLIWITTSANADPEGVAARLFDPLLLPGFADSGAHLTNMAFYDNNLRALKIAQERGRVGFMVSRLTSEPARFFGLEVGTIEVGAAADLALIDPDALAAYRPDESVTRITREALDTEQLVNRPEGVVCGVWIGGRRLVDERGPTEALGETRAGRLLRPTNHWPTELARSAGQALGTP